jgi:aryl-alcohol dehydrogenase-like predicted oxidoreductase
MRDANAGDPRVQREPIERRLLGSTGATVSRLGLGLAALGRPGYINVGHAADLRADYAPGAMELRAHAVLDAARGAGVTYFDVARSYGRGEEFLAHWLAARGIAPGECIIGSKWGYTYTADWRVDAPIHERKEHSLATFTRQIAESRALLGEHLALYQVHSATLDSGILDDARVLAAMARLRESGIAVGLTASGAEQLRVLDRALEVRIDGERLFATLQATWNVLERSAEPALERARAGGVAVIGKEALANGRLTERNRDPAFRAPLARLQAEAARLGTSVDALALAAVLDRPWADTVLSGAATVEQLRSNADACAVTFDERARSELEQLTEAPERYWATRSSLAWN